MISLHDFKINNDKSDVFSDEIKSWIKPFVQELNNYVKKSDDPEPWRLYTEAPMTGFLINGIIRQDNDYEKAVLQEFCVNEETSYAGRCDFLLIVGKIAYIVETKFLKTPTYGIKKWNELNYNGKMVEVQNQVKNYYHYEAEAYRGYDNVVLVTLIFYYVQQRENELNDYIDTTTPPYLAGSNRFYGLLKSDEQDINYKGQTCLDFFGRYDVIAPIKKI